MVGTGKSTIASTIARTCNDERRLGANFFFSKGDQNLRNAGLFFTITFQLANRIPGLKPLVCEAVTKTPNISDLFLKEQW